MAAIVGIILAAIIVIVLIYPFMSRRRVSSPGTPDRIEQVTSADTLRHLLYREPVTLRNEYESGNITADEYEEQLAELRLRAAQLMRDRTEHRTQLLEAELVLEREVQRIRMAREEGEDAET